MDNVNTIPRNSDIEGWHPKLKPIKEEDKLGAAIPLTMLLHRAYQPTPPSYTSLYVPPAREPESGHSRAVTEASTREASKLSTTERTRRALPHLPLFEQHVAVPISMPVPTSPPVKAVTIFSQGATRPSGCVPAKGPAPIYLRRVR